MCTEATNAAWQRTEEESGPRPPPPPAPTQLHLQTCCICSPLYSVHLLRCLLPYGMVSMETEVVRKKKEKENYQRVSFSPLFFLSPSFVSSLLVFVSLALPLPPCLRRSLKVKQRAERSISLINTTQQHSALRGEMKRHGGMSTCRPGVVLTNDTYHTSHG